jgi:type IV secretion system protein VirB10
MYGMNSRQAARPAEVVATPLAQAQDGQALNDFFKQAASADAKQRSQNEAMTKQLQAAVQRTLATPAPQPAPARAIVASDAGAGLAGDIPLIDPQIARAINVATGGRLGAAQQIAADASQMSSGSAVPIPAATARPEDSALMVQQAASPTPEPMVKAVTQVAHAVNAMQTETQRINDSMPGQRIAPRSAYELTAGSIIPAELVTAIDSSLPGTLVGQVRQNVYDSLSGRNLLIPIGSRLIGTYQSHIAYGQNRVIVAWQRVIFPDTSSLDLLNQAGADVDGRAGLGGTVDAHTGRIVGALLLTSILSAAAGQAGAYPHGSVIIGSSGQDAAQSGAQIIQREANVPPTIFVPKGYPFVVVVDRDIAFAQPYETSR